MKLSLTLVALALSPSAFAGWTCIADCDGDQIGSSARPTKGAALLELYGYCEQGKITNVRCFNRGNPSADLPALLQPVGEREATDESGCFETRHQQCMDRKRSEENDCQTRERRSECVAECREEALKRCAR